MNDAVTIAIPTFNRGHILVDTLDLLLNLRHRADEILVVDQTPSYSADIENRLASHAQNGDIRWIRLSRPSVPHAMNEALRLAVNPIVLFVDDDVQPASDLAENHKRAYSDEIWAVVGQVLQPGEEVQHFDAEALHRGLIRDLEFRFNHDSTEEVENVIACNLSVRRDKALKIGGFDENFLGAAYRFETDFARRVVEAGGRIRFEPRARLAHLHIPTGGIRSHGDYRKSANAAHSAGDYYFALCHIRPFWPYALQRFRRNVLTRWLLTHPWYLFHRLIAEIRGYTLARTMYRRGRRLLE